MKKTYQAKINLLDYKFEKQRERQGIIREYSLYLALILLLLAGVYAANYFNQLQVSSLQAVNQELEAEYRKITASDPDEPESSQPQITSADPRYKTLQGLEKEKNEFSKLIEETYLVANPDLVIANMAIKKGELLIDAYTSQQAGIIKFLAQLEENPYIKEIKQIDSKFNNGEYSFTIALTWEGDI